ncbi:hypothetical protein T4C_483 [Trichinella pseudospiralis]|uniref:Uncharacterized protein n=1 Tax=Trichinella pseudospiralis TaxID=6337 RepID=A0A0V1GW26_TRIPS|nr:hypothetical protein T4C_483 [Trichinella pseudospiralis]
MPYAPENCVRVSSTLPLLAAMHPSCQNVCRFVTSAVEAFFRAITVLPQQPLMACCIPVLNSNN